MRITKVWTLDEEGRPVKPSYKPEQRGSSETKQWSTQRIPVQYSAKNPNLVTKL